MKQHMQQNKQNLIICIDASISMSDRFGSTTRIKAVSDAVESMLPRLSSQYGTMIGLTGYNGFPFVVHPLTFPNSSALLGKVKSIKAGGCTNLLGGIDLSMDLLISRPSFFSRRIIALTDGNHNSGSLTKTEVIAKARQNRIVIDTVGMGSEGDYNKSLLCELSSATGGEFIAASDLPLLFSSFQRLSRAKNFFPGSGKRNDKGKGKVIPFKLFGR